MVFDKARLRAVGERAVLAEYGDEIHPDINLKVRGIARALENEKPLGIGEVIPAYRSLLILYDPMRTNLESVSSLLESIEGRVDQMEIPAPRIIEIPVCYGGRHGPDLAFVARFNGMTEDDVVRIHSGIVYRIYLLGFTPGFAYLGELPERLRTPRLETPRSLVHAGSVGIADNQTGIYPLDSPGGWRIIGRTPLKPFDPSRTAPFLYGAGDLIRFTPISQGEYQRSSGGGTI